MPARSAIDPTASAALTVGRSAPRVALRHRRRLITAAFTLTAVLTTNLVDLFVNGLGHGLRVLDANWELSWSHDIDRALLAAGLAAAAIGVRRRGKRRRLWMATAVIVALFVVDEASPLHARIDALGPGKMLYIPILALLIVLLWRLARGTDQRAIVVAGLVTLCAAFAMHVVVVPSLRPLGYYNGLYQTAVGLKEGLETGGLILTVSSLCVLAYRKVNGS